MRHTLTRNKTVCSLAGMLATLTAAASFVGCDQAANDQRSASVDSRFILPSEPDGAVTPTEAMASHSDPKPIVLVGRIDAGDFDPFEPGQASFMLSELPDTDHAGGDPDHADNCPFCKRKLEKAPKAVIKILAPSGDVMPVDARELLGIAKGDIVVVRGTGQYTESVNLIEIAANGIYRR